MKLPGDFYNQSTIKVAQELLGKFLVRQYHGKKISGMICETEAYVGFKDKASHASRGRTRRTEIMFGPAGYAYVYLIYGMYYCLNVVTARVGYPAAVLIRAVEPYAGAIKFGVASGPGKLCRYFKIDKKLNGVDLTGHVLWIEDQGVLIKKSAIKRGQRIGVDYAGEYKKKLWRYYV